MMPITKTTIKLFRFINKHKNGVSEENIVKNKKFKIKRLGIMSLYIMGYLMFEQDGNWRIFSSEHIDLDTTSSTKWYTTEKTVELLEKRRTHFIQWILPFVCSLLALIISIIGLYFSLAPSGVVNVRILP